MDTRTAKRLILPATLAVATFISANSCKRDSYEEYCADIENMADCDAAGGCTWDVDTNVCNNTCDEFLTQADCEAVDRCEWSEAGEGDTDGGASCHQPFT